jgi:phosphoglycolate phosphatase
LYRRHYVALARTSTAVMPGAHESLAAVAKSGAETVIITAKHQFSVAPCLAATGLTADRVFTLAHGPEKASILRRISASLYVGDTPADVQAACDAGVTAVGVTTGSFEADSLADEGADVILETLEDFPAWYTGQHELTTARAARSPTSPRIAGSGSGHGCDPAAPPRTRRSRE